MSLGLVGRKVGMTRIFTEQGESIPVTVLEMEPNRVTQVKTSATDGYNAIQVTVGTRRASRVTKAAAGHFAKAGVEAGRKTVEFRLDEETELTAGSEIKADIFAEGQIVDVTGTSIGKGFQGGIKRHNFHRQDMTHGNSISHRSNGSIGQNQTPGRVFKGKKMSGHMGAAKSTVQNIQVVRVDVDKNLILVRGGVPGSKNSDVIIKPAVKA
ncbi:MAG: 50S ribosomal protein L3 [gamma proteobacterium symbiont of Lucinoma myriamae]|nr:50S ribosomal protein L3 [gamma proteobacterium symbiont of Lucinoma myriamae]MCU7817689.1 50S ribosomal protein L3 [gamma proteobacterium symbiont of Lucinoma myriamae]MCU7831031.1 50S ribosomal protein L3 [gamma proteobacterium symbiont of Lucinoma myriamae]